MKILKVILGGIVLIVVLLLIVALFVKKDYAVEREITINKPKSQVFEYIKLLKNQDLYSVWLKRDPAAKKEYKGTDGTVGFVAAWESKDKNVGKGEQEIIKITGEERIDMKLRFKEPFESNDDAYMITESVSETQTKVKWGFKGRMKYPMNLMLLCWDMEGMLGKDLQKGLDDLKVILEK
ncbi:SRPBCC family protein [Pedobacter caeni]|uniref:Polyketide cyclase / dehydrase and lipid transport n=1 Tax=Pedobacter caeni TaxID=288992 RepID=A0A1M4WL86_9SPHI|nr:SRPBCC family protein [Pedobacter caeni]SHE81967.1 Polyketide cyclase / dehydrase and lipid transport [Pedobacter caeni]